MWSRKAKSQAAARRLESQQSLDAAQRSLEASGRSLETARRARAEQARKREQEQEALIARLDRLAGQDSNHLGALVLEALTERYRRGQNA